jgi:hypothetical protein
MAFAWQGLMYVQDGVVSRGAVTRQSGAGPWQAWVLTLEGCDPVGDFSTVEEAQVAIEKVVNAT